MSVSVDGPGCTSWSWWSSVVASESSVRKWTLGLLEGRGLDIGLSGGLLGRVFPVPGSGCLIIRGWVEKPSGVASARALRFRSLVTSVLAREVGGSGLKVSVSGAVKLRGLVGCKEVCHRVGKTVSMNLQLANLALSRCLD